MKNKPSQQHASESKSLSAKSPAILNTEYVIRDIVDIQKTTVDRINDQSDILKLINDTQRKTVILLGTLILITFFKSEIGSLLAGISSTITHVTAQYVKLWQSADPGTQLDAINSVGVFFLGFFANEILKRVKKWIKKDKAG